MSRHPNGGSYPSTFTFTGRRRVEGPSSVIPPGVVEDFVGYTGYSTWDGVFPRIRSFTGRLFVVSIRVVADGPFILLGTGKGRGRRCGVRLCVCRLRTESLPPLFPIDIPSHREEKVPTIYPRVKFGNPFPYFPYSKFDTNSKMSLN